MLVINSCNQLSSEKLPPVEKKELKYVQTTLDTFTNYQITIPENYVIHTYTGFDTITDSLIVVDSSICNFGNVEIIFTLNNSKIFPRIYTKILKDSTRIGEILNSPVEWKIFEFENCITAQASERFKNIHNGIEVFAKATSYSNIDSLIKIVSSIKK